MPILHQCADYLVRYNPAGNTDVAVVTFDPWSPEPGLTGEFFAETFFLRRSISAIGIKPARNDWYLGSAMTQVVQAIREATRGMRLVGYGGSMGGFGVINFAQDLNLADLLAIGPQFSIDPAKAPFETRWTREAQELTFENDRIARIPPIRKGWVVYDPTTDDARHANLIRQYHDLTPIRLYFADHHPLAILQQTGLREQLLLDLAANRLDRSHFVQELRRRRRQSSWYWLYLSKELQSRGMLEAAFRAIEAAKAVPNTGRWFPLDVQHATLHQQSGQRDAAVALIEPYLAEEPHAAAARWLLNEWQAQAA
jgi:hypothetical protein